MFTMSAAPAALPELAELLRTAVRLGEKQLAEAKLLEANATSLDQAALAEARCSQLAVVIVMARAAEEEARARGSPLGVARLRSVFVRGDSKRRHAEAVAAAAQQQSSEEAGGHQQQLATPGLAVEEAAAGRAAQPVTRRKRHHESAPAREAAGALPQRGVAPSAKRATAAKSSSTAEDETAPEPGTCLWAPAAGSPGGWPAIVLSREEAGRAASEAPAGVIVVQFLGAKAFHNIGFVRPVRTAAAPESSNNSLVGSLVATRCTQGARWLPLDVNTFQAQAKVSPRFLSFPLPLLPSARDPYIILRVVGRTHLLSRWRAVPDDAENHLLRSADRNAHHRVSVHLITCVAA